MAAESTFVPADPSIEVHIDDAQVRLVLAGSLGTRTCETLLEAAREVAGTGRDVEVACADIEFLGLAALQVLLSLRRTCGRTGRAVRLSGVRPAVGEMLAITGFAEALGLTSLEAPLPTTRSGT